MSKWRIAFIVLLVLTAFMLVGLLAIRTVAPVRAPTLTGTAASTPGPAPTPTAQIYQAPEEAFRVAYPTTWRPAQQPLLGWWWFAPAADALLDAPPDVTVPPPPPTPTPPVEETLSPEHAGLPNDDTLPPIGPAVLLSYAPLGDPQRDPEDAVYRWMLELESILPWTWPEVEDAEGEARPWQRLQTLQVGDGQYPAAQADFAWETPVGPIQARLVLVKVYGQVWALFAYASPEAWPEAEHALSLMQHSLQPAPDPPPAVGEPES